MQADAEGNQTQPVKPVVPVFAASWEPATPSTKMAKAARRLQAKAANGAKPVDDWSGLFAQADTAVQQLVAEAKLPVHAHVHAKKVDPLQNWLKSAWSAAPPQAPVSSLAAAPKSTLAAAPKQIHILPPVAVRRSHWLKALNRPMSIGDSEQEQTVAQPVVNAEWQKALSWKTSLRGNGATVLPVLKRDVERAKMYANKAAGEPATRSTAAAAEKRQTTAAQHTAAAVQVQEMPITGEALVQDWMQALGLDVAPSSAPAALKSAVSSKKEDTGHVSLQKEPVESPAQRLVFSAHWELKPKVQVAMHVAKANTGILAKWFSALHRKPESMFQIFADGGDGSRRAEANSMHKQNLLTEHMQPTIAEQHLLQRVVFTPLSTQQQLTAKGAWAKALGSNNQKQVVQRQDRPQVGSTMWGDVLVHMHTPLVPDAALLPTVSTSISPRMSQQVAAKVGERGQWIKALNRESHTLQVKASRSSMLAATPDSERYSTAIMREALEEGESAKAAALEHATRGVIRNPFNDKTVPIGQTLGQHSLWNN